MGAGICLFLEAGKWDFVHWDWDSWNKNNRKMRMGFQFEQHRLGLWDLGWDLKKTICWEMGLGTPLHDPHNLHWRKGFLCFSFFFLGSLSLLQLQPNFTFNLQNLILVVHPFHSIELLCFITSFWPVSEYNNLLPFCFSIFPAEHLRLKPGHSTPVKFENGVFNLKAHQMFHVHTSLEEFTSPARGHLEFVFQKNGYC